MANTTVNLEIYRVGPDGEHLQLPVDGGAHIYKGTLLSTLTATGMAVPGSTAGSGRAVAVSTHEQDASAVADGVKEVRAETDRDFLFANGAGGDACSDATLIGATLWMVDDHTVGDNDGGATRQIAGTFRGMDPSGKVRVRVTPN